MLLCYVLTPVSSDFNLIVNRGYHQVFTTLDKGYARVTLVAENIRNILGF